MSEDNKGITKTRSRTDNAMPKRKGAKGQNNDTQNVTQKIGDRTTRTPLTTGMKSGVPKG